MRRRWITFWRIVHNGVVNFIRNSSLAIAAMAVMVVTLTIILFSLIANAAFANSIQQITDKIDISVYMKDSVSEADGRKLASDLKKQPDVKSVRYLTKAEAIKIFADENKNLPDIAIAAQATQSIPATIRIKPTDLNQIPEIKKYLTKPAVFALQDREASYSGNRKEAIDNITHATNVLREIGIAAVAVFALISVLIIFNTIQMAIFNRRDEITIMRLLGASTSYIRGPFVAESIIYGILSAVISVLIINSAFLASNNALQASSLGFLDINFASSYFGSHFWKLLTLQVAIGIIIGSVSSTIATRRYLKFKTK